MADKVSFWEKVEQPFSGNFVYRNVISDVEFDAPPTLHRGGILADEDFFFFFSFCYLGPPPPFSFKGFAAAC